jgi:hypothetical protein
LVVAYGQAPEAEMGLQEKPMNWNDDNADAAAKDAYCKIDGHNAQLKCKVSDHAPFMPPPPATLVIHQQGVPAVLLMLCSS